MDAIAEGVAKGEVSPSVDPELAAVALAGAIVYRRVMTAARFEPDRVSDLIDTVLGPVGTDNRCAGTDVRLE